MKQSLLLIIFTITQLMAFGQAKDNKNNDRVTISGSYTLRRVFEIIREQTGRQVTYANSYIDDQEVVTVKLKNSTIDEVLQTVLKGKKLQWVYNHNYITIRPKMENAGIMNFNDMAPPIDISGKVTTDKGEPLPGATVLVFGTEKGATTNNSGKFELANVANSATLIVSYTGFDMQSVKLNGRSHVDIKLNKSILEMATVSVYSSGYQNISKERATGSYDYVSEEQLDKVVATDILSKLNGIASGVVFNSKLGGGEKEIAIRGRSTIFGSATPLIVVDNFPYDGMIENINPNDIASITVLKDAAAASIWGVRAGNGVIVITTKKGRFNQPMQMELVTNFTLTEKPDLYYNPRFVSASDFIDLERSLFNKGVYDAKFTDPSFPVISPVINMLEKIKNGSLSKSIGEQRINELRNVDSRKELRDQFYRNGLSQQYALNLRQGNNVMSNFLSVGYDRVASSQKGQGNNRFTLNYLTTFSPIRKLEFTFGVNYIQSESSTDNTVSRLARSLYPYNRFTDSNGNELPIDLDYQPDFTASAPSKGFLNWQFYPMDELKQKLNVNTIKNFDTRITAGIKYSFFKRFSIDIKGQYERGVNNNQSLHKQGSYYTRNFINQYATLINDKVTKFNIPLGDIMDYKNSELLSKGIRAQLNFNYNEKKHTIIALLGTEARESKNDSRTGVYYGYNENNATSAIINPWQIYPRYPRGDAGTIPYNPTINGNIDRVRSFFANAAYTFNAKYILTVSGRIDQSNLFGVNSNQKSVPLWSTGVKWNISQESFCQIAWLPLLQLRSTYGYNGNLNRAVSAYTTAEFSVDTDPLGSYVYGTINSAANPDLRWEKIGILNLGIDFSLKNNVITGSIEYFTKSGKDIIGDTPLPPSTGFITAKGNFSNMKGKGIDLTINSNVGRKNFFCRTTLMISHATDIVTKYSGSHDQPYLNGTYIPVVEGRPVNSIYSFKWGGLNPKNGNPQGYLGDTLTENYSAFQYLPIEQWDYIGPAQPVYSGSLQNTIIWKNISLYINIIYKGGYYFRRESVNYSDFASGVGPGLHKDYLKRWKQPGDEMNTQVPSELFESNFARDFFYNASNILIERGDHIRLQNINLTLNLNRKIIKELPFNNMLLYLTANNLGVLWRMNKQGIDPDYGSSMPSPRSYSLGVKASF
ncbi:SusC/RagA family TonB-linked outer membrane protein [Chitinophaga nivalis]|uniref:SusC/RagA family TonB-linked outer membrane protein n=1 Tax=Chitinophaga nivalis TaxID=2991709 RepID=A0ABT3IR16_9BACT|nr:SusC/RagA family TonB-linked outer membrane protein [Chitinophaga nivalis]MCW3464105.1 SusC/RagA family TonB-linked outer membrane protein [Chitinophaga nivalis]MCW3486205.1 SusC/RagA family TonB-linked outer membrane protein [Chitinophaga nivalis]